MVLWLVQQCKFTKSVAVVVVGKFNISEIACSHFSYRRKLGALGWMCNQKTKVYFSHSLHFSHPNPNTHIGSEW